MRILPILLFLSIAVSCSVPKVINESGRVTPKGQVLAGATYMSNVSGVSVSNISSTLQNAMEGYQTADSAYFNGTLRDANKAMVSYALDPLSLGSQFYFRVGVLDRVEVGYLRAKSTNMFHGQFQFMGFSKDPEIQRKKKWYGSVGLRYSWNKYSLPKYFQQVQQVLGYSYSRRDFLVPVIFSYTFGGNEEFGSVSFGSVFGSHTINYSFIPNDLFSTSGVELQAVDYKNKFASVGFFANLKIGYRFIYIVPSFSFYYQKYGNYPLLDKSTVLMKGWTFVPGISLQLNTFKKGTYPKKERRR